MISPTPRVAKICFSPIRPVGPQLIAVFICSDEARFDLR